MSDFLEGNDALEVYFNLYNNRESINRLIVSLLSSKIKAVFMINAENTNDTKLAHPSS